MFRTSPRRSSLLAAALLLAGGAALGPAIAASAQQRPVPPPGAEQAVVSGGVIDGLTSRAIEGALVEIRPRGGALSPNSSAARTDERGRFLLAAFPPGRVTVLATHPHYLAGGAGQRRPAGRVPSLEVPAGATLDDVTVRLWPPAIVSGRVTDATGAPLAGAGVAAIPARWRDPTNPSSSSWRADTNDLGEYELSAIPPGAYWIAVRASHLTWAVNARRSMVIFPEAPSNASARTSGDGRFSWAPNIRAMPPRLAGGREAVFVTTGHPGTTDPAAFTRFDLAAGETRRNVDITLATAPRVRVRGIALGPNGPLGQVTVRLQRQHGGLGGEDGVRATGHADGHFEFLSVPPGSYELNAYRVLGESDVVLPDPDGYWARMPFTIGEQDVDDLTVRLMPGVTVRARIEMDGVAAAEVFPISLVSTGTFRLGAGTRARPAPGTFEVTGVAPGEYLWSTGGRREGTLVSIERGGLDITGEPLIVGTTDIDDVLISTTSRPALVRGTVSPPAGTPVELLSAVLLPVDPRRRGTVWNQTTLVRSVDLPPEGTFAFERLPPGRYAVAAVDEATMAGWPAPDLLDRLAASADVITIGVGQTLVHDLVVRR